MSNLEAKKLRQGGSKFEWIFGYNNTIVINNLNDEYRNLARICSSSAPTEGSRPHRETYPSSFLGCTFSFDE